MKTFTHLIPNAFRFASMFLLIFCLNVTIFSQTNEIKLGFTGSYPIRWYDNGITFNHTINFNWQWYKELNMNLWSGWAIEGTDNRVKDSMTVNSIRGWFQPDTMIYRAAYGRISIYEAEVISNRFTYGNHHNSGSNYTDNTWGNGVLVRYYDAIPSQTSYTAVLTELSENCEQVFTGLGIPVTGADLRWYIKPRMRITTTDAFGTVKDVAKIVVKAYNGDVIKEEIITTEDFRYDNSTTYDGRYLEDYFLHNVIVLADSLTRGANYDNPHEPDLVSSLVDYQIYWYGNVDLWIDYVKVMDNNAHDFLGPNPLIRNAIKGELNQIKDYDNLRGFFTEEIAYNNLRCLKALQDSLAIWSDNNPNAKLICLINDYSFQYNLKTHYSTDYADYLDMARPPVMLLAWYHFNGSWGTFEDKIPDNISTFHFRAITPDTIQTEVTSYFNAMRVSKAQYQTDNQRIYDAYADTLDRFKDLCDARGIPLYAGPQIQHNKLWQGANTREPTNEEINAEYGISLCHGVTGFMPYAFETWYASPSLTGNVWQYNCGLLDSTEWHVYPDPITCMEKRTLNFFGQNKWQNFVDLYAKITRWSPVIANSTNTEGWSVARDGANHNYISDIQSIAPDINGTNSECAGENPSAPYLDCNNKRYWEMGFFSPNYLPSSDKYFMMVNRRCIPAIGGYAGDNRVLKIKFKASQLPEAVNWKITDVLTRDSYIFSRNYNGYVALGSTSNSMGWFDPGEGKLFKLEPVLKSGGILVANEDVSGS